MAVINGAFGSSENSAVHGRPASSLQCAVAESAVEVNVTGPGRTLETSSGAAARRQHSAALKHPRTVMEVCITADHRTVFRLRATTSDCRMNSLSLRGLRDSASLR